MLTLPATAPSVKYLRHRADTARSITTIHAALDAGVTLIDTADAYHRDAGEVGHNEELIARALRESAAAPATCSSPTRRATRPGAL